MYSIAELEPDVEYRLKHCTVITWDSVEYSTVRVWDSVYSKVRTWDSAASGWPEIGRARGQEAG